MATAFLAAMRSKDPATQVGAAIVNDKNRIVGTRKLFCPSTASEMSVRRIVFRQIVLPLFTV